MKSIDPISAPSAEANPIRTAIEQAIAENPVILFMKGSPDAPACGFSRRTAAALQSLDVAFAAVDVLPDPRIRQELSSISNWPTIPQLFVDGEFIGGCDIVTEMRESGELAELLGVPDDTAQEPAQPADVSAASGLQIENRLG
jgi:monothiol glutaredoxin